MAFGSSRSRRTASLYINDSGTPPNTPMYWNAKEEQYSAAGCAGTITITNVQQQAVSGTFDITFCDDYSTATDHVSCTFTNIPRGS